MTVHVYNLRGEHLRRFYTLDGAKAWCDDRPRRYFSTWDDHTGEKWERKGGEWKLLAEASAAEPAETVEQWWQR